MLLEHLRHEIDATVTGDAPHPFHDMDLVVEEHVPREVVHARPSNGLIFEVGLA
jgi:hypothetical protein